MCSTGRESSVAVPWGLGFNIHKEVEKVRKNDVQMVLFVASLLIYMRVDKLINS